LTIPADRADHRASRSWRLAHPRVPTNRHRHAPAEAGSGRDHPPVRRRRRGCLRAARLQARPRPAVQRPRRRSLPRPVNGMKRRFARLAAGEPAETFLVRPRATGAW